MFRELSPDEVIYKFDANDIDIGEKKSFLPEYEEVYGRIRTAFEIEQDGYNVFLIDDFSKDKLDNIMSYIKDILKSRERAHDICYVVEEDEKCPKALFLSGGNGNILKNTLEKIQDFYIDIIFDFYNSSSNREKEDIIDDIQKVRNELISDLIERAEEDGFDIKFTSSGFSFIPLDNGKNMSEKQYEELETKRKDEILEKVVVLKSLAQDVLQQIKEYELKELEKIKILLGDYFKYKTEAKKEEYRKNFDNDVHAIEFLDYVCSDIEEKIVENYSINYEDDEEKIHEIIYKHLVNVIVDNSQNSIPPVIFEEDPNVNNLLGSIEYENRNGVYATDASLIKGGSMLKANEGCLIIRLSSILSNSSAFYYLKKSLLSGKVDMDFNRGYLEILSLNGLKPEPININEKIIVIGDYESYDILYNYDEDFKKIFMIKAEYKPIVDIDRNSKKALVDNIYLICKKNNMTPLTDKAIKEIVKYLSRKAESRNKLCFDSYEINKVLMVSSVNIKMDNKSVIDDIDIINTVNEKEILEKDIIESYKEKKMLLDVKGSHIGQVNGLSVIDTGYISIGRPLKITCSCYKGDGSIIDVHKESNLSGSIHNKSINILKGYINNIVGGYSRIPVDFHISFEQLYGKIDGDSASVAEIVCMLSAFSKIPVKQNIAVTGSINQFGEVQPVGGINEKIEGFFNACNVLDSIEEKGVLIPYCNMDNLVLNYEVECAIENGKFHLYTMSRVEDAVELLMGQDKIDMEYVINSIRKEMKKYTIKEIQKKLK